MTLTVDAVTPESRAVGHEAQRRRSSVRGEKRNGSWGEKRRVFLVTAGLATDYQQQLRGGKSSMGGRGRRARGFVRQENLVCCLGDDDGRRRRGGTDRVWRLPAGLGWLGWAGATLGALVLVLCFEVQRGWCAGVGAPCHSHFQPWRLRELSCMRLVWRNLHNTSRQWDVRLEI
jgi:hypothetical protein